MRTATPLRTWSRITTAAVGDPEAISMPRFIGCGA
jgi:hypothetical protein